MLNQTLIWLLVIVLSVLGLLLLYLVRWNKKLKIALDIQLANHNATSSQLLKLETASKNTTNFNTITFVVLAIVVFGTAVFSYEYNEVDEDMITSAAEAILIVAGLMGGFLLGGLWRRFESVHFLTQLLGQINQREWVERKLSLSEARLIKQQQALATLAQNPNRKKQYFAEIFRDYAQTAADTLNVERVSIWLNIADNTMLECVDFYTKSNNTHRVLESVAVSEIPKYFHELNQHRVIAADDAMQHPALQELTDGYLQDNNIGAVLDGGIWVDGSAAGVVCIEHVGGVREWTSDEQSFVGAIADLARVTIETCKRRTAEQALLERSAQLEQMVLARTQSLQESNQRFSYVLQVAPIAILIFDRNGNIVDLNNEATSASGYSREYLLGKHFIKTIVAKESRKQAAMIAACALQGKNVNHIELLLQNAAGEKYEYECSIGMTVKNADDSAGDSSGHMVAIAQNISQQRALQKSLIKAREAAEATDRIKSMFVASMSHELRTPLNSIIGFIGVVLQGISGELNPVQKGQLDRAYQSSKHLLLLISDVLDVSKIEAGFLQLNIETFELKPLLIELEHAVQHLLAGKDLALGIVCTNKLKVTTDRKRLYQVLLNVLSNAVKYTEQGSVKMHVQLEGNQLVVSCKDTGIGIAESNFTKLYQPFERVESPLKIKTPGTGLGLYLTHKILTQLLGGSITVQSELGQGTAFTIIIPINKPANDALTVASDADPNVETAVL